MTAAAPVLVALDPADLESQAHILTAAQAEAKARGTGLALILVIEGMRHAAHGGTFADMRQSLMREAAERADAWAEQMLGGGGTGIATHVAHGDADEQILAAAERLGAQAIVMGERRERALERVVGSIAQSVSGGASVPVVLVPPAG